MRALLTLLIGLACAPAGAAEAPLSAQTARGLPALLARAVPRDPQVQAAQAALAGAQARYRQARSRLLPSAGVQATRGRSNDLDGAVDVERRTQQVEANLRWNLYNGGADRAEMVAAEREATAAEADVRRAREESAERLAEAYFDVQRLDRGLLRSEARLAEVAQLVAQVGRQTDAGKASELDAQLAQSSQLDAELTQDGLLSDRLTAQLKLSTLAAEPVKEFSDFAFADAAPAGLDTARHAPLLAAQERAAAARLRVRNLAATLAPKVDVDVRHLLNNHTTPPPSTVQQRGWSIGISWDFPLGGESLARRDESVSRAEQADADVTRAEQTARAEFDTLAPRIASAERALAMLAEQEKKLTLLVRGGAIQFEAGRRNLQQLIQTRDSYFVVEQRRIDQRHRLILAQMRQLALSGRLLDAFGLAP
ncbi:TolC family protein [Janthinobacterium sp.]|uniref:TolC family protein n=1 Tax=Janthinobacterium sp. TaxID=1871054 RepID=UPI00293D70CD|nr:TolC family protein [Janthinobacterium sp.]